MHAQFFAELPPIDTAAERDIGEQHVEGRAILDQRQRRLAVGRLDHAASARAQIRGDVGAHEPFVLDHEDGQNHLPAFHVQPRDSGSPFSPARRAKPRF
jgi:hypothetical protein